jgi:hypothetical protein
MSLRVGTTGKGSVTQSVKEGEYGGCTLYTCIKIQWWNLLKFSKEQGREIRKKLWVDESNQDTL